MFKIGCHLSASKGFLDMAETIEKLGGNTFQFFSRNPRGGSAKDIDLKDIENFQNKAKEVGIEVILAHAPYTLNFASKDESIRKFAKDTLIDDLARMDLIPGNLYNIHPGSHVGQGVEVGIDLIVEILNEALREDQKTILLLETMAGKGSEVGRNFEEIAKIIDGVKLKDKIGVCLDTCHVHEGGYDIVNNLDEVLNEFDRIIGLDRLRAIHINDSKNPIEAHKDRHEKIGEGYIGKDAFERIINHPKLRELPFYLETPNELEGYAKEIELLKSLYK